MTTGTFPKKLHTILEFRTSLMYFIAHRVSAKKHIKIALSAMSTKIQRTFLSENSALYLFFRIFLNQSFFTQTAKLRASTENSPFPSSSKITSS